MDRFATAPEVGYGGGDIDLNNVFLNDSIRPEGGERAGRSMLIRFDRQALAPIIAVGEVELAVTGRFADGRLFEGSDVITVIDKQEAAGPQDNKR